MPVNTAYGTSSQANEVVRLVGQRKVMCFKGFIVDSHSTSIIKFIPNIEDPLRYYLIPKQDVYCKLDIDLPPFGKGHMIWGNFENIQLAEPPKPLRPIIVPVPVQLAGEKLSGVTPKEGRQVDALICPSCQYANTPSAYICEKCQLVLRNFMQ